MMMLLRLYDMMMMMMEEQVVDEADNNHNNNTECQQPIGCGVVWQPQRVGLQHYWGVDLYSRPTH